MKIIDFPKELRNIKQWVCSNDDKIPRWTSNARQFASPTDYRTWGTLSDAIKCVNNETAKYIGFVFTKNDPFCFIDLDSCISPDNKLNPSSLLIMNALNSYTERSKSKTGIHIIIRASLKDKDRNRICDIEIYDRNRVALITCDKLEPYPFEIMERQIELDTLYSSLFPKAQKSNNQDTHISILTDEQIIGKASIAKNGSKFTDLFYGSIDGYPSASEADQALCNILAFWCCGNMEQMDRIFRISNLMRDKWKRQDYREQTIRKAISGTPKFYTGNTN
jgi:primase-polymerase (primpol)-like protein